ncbi:hypothetical protein MACK_000778 [Theileria orientalis]|uniref:Uncharacterized protein n=1 Tax=Theileria orientalis TaxID=68886 RepID=A0A976MCN7_THEOR|nr:hypothetical protein MACK_000778 [Theileria orientalis]
MSNYTPTNRRIRCFSFRRRRNVFDYVDVPSQATLQRLHQPTSAQREEPPEPSKNDDNRSDTTDDEQDIEPETKNHDTYHPYVTNYNPKEKYVKNKSSSKKGTPKSSIGEPPPSSKPSLNHVQSGPNYLEYGVVDLQSDFQKLSTGTTSRASRKGSVTYHSFTREDSAPSRDVLGVGSRLLIGGKLSDGKPSMESRVWDMIERRGWGMVHENWNMVGARVFNNIVKFLTGMEISLCRQVCKGWYQNVSDVMVMRSEVIVSAFKKAYKDKLDYDRSYILFQPVLTATKSLRIDVIIRAKVQPYCTLHKNSFGYTYSYQSLPSDSKKNDVTPSSSEPSRRDSIRETISLFNRKLSKSKNVATTSSADTLEKKSVFISKFIFEVLKKNSCRTITFTRDLSSMHADDINLATSASVCQVCEGDYIEVPITLISAIGATDVKSIKFLPIVRDVLSKVPSHLDLLHREWYTVEPNSKYLEQLFPQNIHSYSIIHPHKLLPHLVHQVTQVAGIDVITSKSIYVASHTGMVLESCNIIGHTVEVVPKTDSIICMIQRIGLQHDRICHVQLRPGDNLQFYITKG